MTITNPGTTGTLTGTYALDPTHTRIGFVARHAMVTKVRGSFDTFAGTAVLDADEPARSSAELTIEVASVDTRNAQRDEHLRANDFFDAATYPQIRFVSTSAERVGDDDYRLTGDLTIKGVTKPVTVDFEYTGLVVDPWGNERIGFEGRTVINRRDWGVNFNAALEAGGVLVSDKITLEFDVSAVKTA
jgi:polyisoprenoid-binding protein YceI